MPKRRPRSTPPQSQARALTTGDGTAAVRILRLDLSRWPDILSIRTEQAGRWWGFPRRTRKPGPLDAASPAHPLDMPAGEERTPTWGSPSSGGAQPASNMGRVHMASVEMAVGSWCIAVAVSMANLQQGTPG